MQILQDRYVTYSLAKLLKDKGFPQQDEHNHQYPNESTEEITVWCPDGYYNDGDGPTLSWNRDDGDIACPSHALVLKWLKEHRNIVVNVTYHIIMPWFTADYRIDGYEYQIYDLNNNKKEGSFFIAVSECPNYDDVVEIAIRTALNLIED